MLEQQLWLSPVTQAADEESLPLSVHMLPLLWPALASCLAKALCQELHPAPELIHRAVSTARKMLQYALEAPSNGRAQGMRDTGLDPDALCCAWTELYCAMDG